MLSNLYLSMILPQMFNLTESDEVDPLTGRLFLKYLVVHDMKQVLMCLLCEESLHVSKRLKYEA